MVTINAMADAWREDLRLSILRLLHEAPGLTLNDSLLTKSVQILGISATRDQLRTEVGWLEQQGTIRCQVLSGLIVAELTERGSDAAKGLASIPGISRPSAR
ncbi:VpaChn25_0724 family phage protein [Niveispirillum cyanobacteriorum]|uniref:Uncharacterized protein n=1 Tax=Niveispirillum cyanobacteriorum TaxID=1612173 RepID=A0A2K9NDM3_9PROT|nr:hypothetical protein [Niveispirillum cyanobacteriorum]AUN31250.1 hypothetical protein C0V82_14160 [Niveispirillum cyanobacteriorum]GGE72935.1 hypothetical protein GCM10011317_32710 [Niveispirillum cyanobacteriorum]